MRMITPSTPVVVVVVLLLLKQLRPGSPLLLTAVKTAWLASEVARLSHGHDQTYGPRLLPALSLLFLPLLSLSLRPPLPTPRPLPRSPSFPLSSPSVSVVDLLWWHRSAC